MSYLLMFLGAFIGIIVVILIIVAIVYAKIKKIVGASNVKNIINVAKNVKDIEMEEYTRTKQASGLTNLLEPTILKDFSDFNKDLLYIKAETTLRKIFNAIEKKAVEGLEKDGDLIYIFPNLKEKITDLREQNTDIRYDQVEFHRHAIKNYLKSAGKATITISSTVEYYYSNSGKDNKRNKTFDNYKKQTRYTTEFVYVYDESKFEDYQKIFSISCPNCGAPLKKLGAGNCDYCSSYLEPINLKAWKIVSYKEDYN